MDGNEDHQVQWSKPGTEQQRPHDFPHM
jgi:hypothetical protein